MQTSKWGPPLWKGLHTIAHNYNPQIHNPIDYKIFFEVLGNVLPCKYCRYSYQQYIREIPIDRYLSSQEDMTYWLYLIHNKVNHKLRSQGLLTTPDPSFESVWNKYDQWKADCASKRGKPDTCRMPDSKDRCLVKTKKGRQCSRKQVAHHRCSQHIGAKIEYNRKSRSCRKKR